GGLTNSVLPLPPNHYGSNITVHDVLGGEVRLEHVTVEAENNLRGDHGLYVHNGNVSISASTFEDNCDNDSSDSSGIFATGESQILIDDSVIQANTCSGIVVEGDDAFVRASSTLIAANDGDGVRNKDASTVVLSGDPTGGNAIHDNSGYGASQVAVDGQIIATHNWWGDASGPTHAGNPGGTGEEVTDRVLYDPWLTEAPGPPSPATDLVALLVPPSMSPGETANLGVFLNNVTAMTLQNAVLVFQLPKETEYLYSVPRGEYWRSRHQVIWKLGDLPPGQQFVPAVAVWQHWGVRAETPMESSAAVMAVNLPHPSLDLDTYLAFTGNEVISSHALTAQEIAAALAADPILNAFYQDALDDGLSFYDVALQQTLADGTQALVLVFLDSAALQEGRFVIRAGGDYRVASIVDRTFAFSDQTGGGDFDLDTGDWSFWGSWATDAVRCAESPDDCDPSDWMCYRNCILGNVPGWVLDQLFSAYGLAQSGYACAQCLASGGDACISCSSALVGELTGIGLTGIATDLIKCAADCADDPTSHICDRDKAWCAKQGFAGLLGYNSLRKLDCQEEDCIYAWGTDDRSCGTMTCKECCLYWQSINPDLECEPDPCEEPDNPECDRKDTRVFRASDPNHMSGPGQVTPGQLVTYTISYENVGEGTAYGVYLVSHLPPELDEATLDLAGDGVYFPVSRALLWDVGELAAHAGGSVTFEAQVSTGVVSGTVIMAGATVYFPSVPETTPTNDVVSIVQDVAAFSQELETGEGLPLAITLRGYSPMGTPLAYDVIQDPLNGELSGVSPNLTYTPRDGFEGLDSLSFMVDDGLNASLPAAVTIMVNPGPETIPPEVLATSPDHGASDVPVFVRPQLEDFYLPRLQVRFSEAISETTINTTTLTLLDDQG
ncbi:MAG: Ig-like domain-containing protein, partial [Anaerolineae bacterium]